MTGMHDKLARPLGHTQTYKHTCTSGGGRVTLILALANAHKPINTGTKKKKKYTCTRHKEPLIHHNSLLLIFFKLEKELTQI